MSPIPEMLPSDCERAKVLELLRTTASFTSQQEDDDDFDAGEVALVPLRQSEHGCGSSSDEGGITVWADAGGIFPALDWRL